MKSWSDPQSPWGRRVWYEDAELEAIAEDAVAAAGPQGFIPGRGVDVDLILEQRCAEVDYGAQLPTTMLGRTNFMFNGTISVELDRALVTDSESSRVARRRLRATVAHETSHVLLHARLYEFGTGNLFVEAEPEVPRVLCREPDPRRGGPWWEQQANIVMGALLIPKNWLKGQLLAILTRRGLSDLNAAAQMGVMKGVLDDVADEFDTSFPLALFRLQGLGLLPADTQQQELA